MPYKNNWEESGLYRKFSGEISGREVLGSNLSIQGDCRYDEIKYVINDFTQIEKYDVCDTDIQLLANVDNVAAISKPNLKIAMVATLESLNDWTHKYCEKMQGSSYVCRVFGTIEDAYAWVSQPA